MEKTEMGVESLVWLPLVDMFRNREIDLSFVSVADLEMFL